MKHRRPKVHGHFLAYLVGSDMARSAISRILILPVGGLAVLATTAIAIRAVGSEAFGIVSLLVTLPALIPLSDLGLGGLVTSHLGRFGWTQPAAPRLVFRTGLALVLVALMLIAASSVLAISHTLTSLLGIHVEHGNAVAFAVLAAFSVAIPLGLGGRVLLGLERQSIATLIQGLTPVYALVLLGVVAATARLTFAWVVICLVAASPIAALLQCLGARRAVRHPALNVGRAALTTDRQYRSGWRALLPLTVMSMAIPLALQSDRLVLAHVASETDLSRYALASTLAGSLLGVVGAAGAALWPLFQRQLSDGGLLNVSFQKALRGLSLLGLALGIGITALGPTVSDILSHKGIRPGYVLCLWFSLLIVAIAIQYPLAMMLIAFDDIAYCAAWAVTMMIANVALSVVLARHYGADGPVVASVITTIFVVVIPFAVKVRKRLRQHGTRVG